MRFDFDMWNFVIEADVFWQLVGNLAWAAPRFDQGVNQKAGFFIQAVKNMRRKISVCTFCISKWYTPELGLNILRKMAHWGGFEPPTP